MKPILGMENLQIEITNACHNQCSNCTRMTHHSIPFFMSFEQYKVAVDSVANSGKIVGTMGGEALLHPEFEIFCNYLHSKVPPERCGLWSCFPLGKEHYREVIVETFGNIFLNSHERNDILHGPILVASEELPLEQWQKDLLVDQCWIQNSWSAAINPHGAFFCEVAAALDMIFDLGKGWEVDSNWWKKSPRHYIEQMDAYCKLCGIAMPLKKRNSIEVVDDISPKMFERLKDTSPKIKQGKYILHDLSLFQDNRPMALYKDPLYRDKISSRYGIFLALNNRGYQTPYLLKDWKKEESK